MRHLTVELSCGPDTGGPLTPGFYQPEGGAITLPAASALSF